MKLIMYINLLGLTLFFACKEKPEVPDDPTPYWGEVSVTKNGDVWNASPVAFLNTNLGYGLNISFDSLNRFGILKEAFIIYKIPTEPGTYPIRQTSIQKNDSLVGSQFFYTDADVLYGAYDISNMDSSSYIKLISYDTVTREVKGSFDITFIALHKPYPLAPDTIRLQKGTFHTKVAKN